MTWVLQLVPLFFFVGGVANAAALTHRSTRSYLRRRLGGLLRPALALLIGAPVGAAILVLAGVPAGLVLRVLVFVLLPLWFLGVYVPLTALHRGCCGCTNDSAPRCSCCSAVIALLDLARHITGRIEFGWPNMLLLYALAHQFGFCYRDGWLLNVRRRWLVLAAAGALIALTAATMSPVWTTSMVGLPGG